MESDLSQPVSDWMKAQGFTPYAEAPWPTPGGSPIDLVGRKGSQLIAVELKRSLTTRVIHQAALCDLITTRRYAAVGTRPRTAGVARCEKYGIGLLSVSGGLVTEVVAPRDAHEDHAPWVRQHYAGRMHATLDSMTPGGVGGVPCMKGVGPAQECYERVSAYRVAKPGAKWREIFKAVPGHYLDYKSMCGAMRIVEERRRGG